jgi:phage terminase Nu1 subunit (DNA packaging protein)
LAKAKADSAEMEAAKMAGGLVEKKDAEGAMRSITAAVRAEFERFPDQHAPALAAMADLEEVRAYLKAACEQAQRGLSQAIALERDEMAKAAA